MIGCLLTTMVQLTTMARPESIQGGSGQNASTDREAECQTCLKAVGVSKRVPAMGTLTRRAGRTFTELPRSPEGGCIRLLLDQMSTATRVLLLVSA